ncbi:hypothetical protein BDZ89DRAFT_1144632 [Hymenopellis radicata]|nr:hypothetical protein BDZ89DRAFT_1144632 [Hymenopellis radicata]
MTVRWCRQAPLLVDHGRPPNDHHGSSSTVHGAATACSCLYLPVFYHLGQDDPAVPLPLHAEDTIAKYRQLHSVPSLPPGFSDRERSDGFVAGGHAVEKRDRIIGGIEAINADAYGDKLDVVNVEGTWVSLGIIDSHVDPACADGLNTRGDSYHLFIAASYIISTMLMEV